MTKKKTIHDFCDMKASGEKIAFLTAYDYPTAQFAQTAGLDMLLVGDSLGMCVYGYPGTVPVTMEQCIRHAEAVRRGAPDTFVVGDMPFMSYQTSCEAAVENAGRFLKEAGADAIKLEGGVRVASRIRAIVDAGIVVMGHIGLTPQSSGQLGGHKAQGRTLESARMVVRGRSCRPGGGSPHGPARSHPPGSRRATSLGALSIPVLSIGAGVECDGQLLIVADVIGQFQTFTPKFVKKYCDVAGVVTGAMREYVAEVKAQAFPGEEHCYHMLEGEEEKFRAEFA